jgi:hypothetical protein
VLCFKRIARINNYIMNFKWDLTKFIKEARAKKSAQAVLRKRSKDSVARPKATKNITSKDSRLQGI